MCGKENQLSLSKGFYRNGKQWYKCPSCQKPLILRGRQYFVSAEQVSIIGRLLLKQISIRRIYRAMQVAFTYSISLSKDSFGVELSTSYPLFRQETDENPVIYLKVIALECGVLCRTNNRKPGFGLRYLEKSDK